MSLVETLVSIALTVALSGTALSLVRAGETLARTQPESSDQQQRARVALQAIGADLRDAGAGIERGAAAGPLARYFPAVVPSADAGLTIWTATNRDAQAAAATAVPAGATTVPLQISSTCPPGQSACAFAAGTTAIAFTAGGCRTASRIASVSASALQLASPLAGCSLDAGSIVAEGDVRTYRVDPVARQLLRCDEATGTSVPFLDDVASIAIELFTDAGGTAATTGTSDAELKRVRRVRLTLRFAASNPLLRVPDLAVAIDVAPRNLQLP